MPRAAQTGVRRKQILQAALGCFAELGFTETTMEHIRLRSQSSTGSIYHHFGSKEQLAAAVYLEGIIDYQTGLLLDLSQHKDARTGIFAMVRYHLSWVAKHADWAQYLQRMRQAEFLAQTASDLKALNRDFVKQVARWCAPHIRSGALRDLPRDLFVSILLGPSQEFSRQLLSGRTTSDIETASRILAETTWRALSAEPDGG